MTGKGIPILTVDNVPGATLEFIGCVTASCCLSKSIVADMSANLKNWTIGGELTQYSRMIDDSVGLVLERIRKEAARTGADMVVGFRLSTTSVSSGAAEIIGYGTAVRLVRK
jgi:uncharacterized protein YbjQ (UPF0145 family)